MVRNEGASATHSSSPYRIQHYIPRQFEQVGHRLDDNCPSRSILSLERPPSLEGVPRAPMPPVELLRVDAVQLSHAARQRRIECLDQKMVMVRHLAVGVAPPVEAFDDLRKNVKEKLAIRVNEEDLLARVAAAGYVVDSSGVLNPKWTSHGLSLVCSMRHCKT